MKCHWCCNLESQRYEPEISYVENKCIGKKQCGFCQRICNEQAISFKTLNLSADKFLDKAIIDFTKCSNCLRCVNICPSKAIKQEGKIYDINELLDIVEKDAIFYKHGDGGLTISGGEPLTHGKFLIELLQQAKKRRINTAIETCGYADYEVLYNSAMYLDTILFDIKSLNDDKHKIYTGRSNFRILNNFQQLCKDYSEKYKKVRTPIISGFNDTIEDIIAILKFIVDMPNVNYEALPYHRFGVGKYTALGRIYPMGKMNLSAEKVEMITQVNNAVKTLGIADTIKMLIKEYSPSYQNII